MENNIYLDGRKSFIVNPSLQPEIGLFVEAKYKDRTFCMRRIHPVGLPDEELSLAVLKFDREDRRIVSGELNHILVMTHLKANNIYRAVGVEYLPDSEGDFKSQIKWYKLGEPKIVVTPSAEEAIKSIGTFKRELDDLRHNPSELFKILSQGMRN